MPSGSPRSAGTNLARKAAGGRTGRRRMAPEEREHEILQKAVAIFARQGLEVSTRELANALGITQPLLYRYFSSKEALIDRVYEEVFLRRWNPQWEEWLADRSLLLRERLCRYFKDYARFVLRNEWVRIFLYAALAQPGIHRKYFARLHERHFDVIAREMRREYRIPEPKDQAEHDDEIDLIWSLQSSVFYIGVRKWVYDEPTPRDIDRLIEMRVDAFLIGTPAVLHVVRETTRRA